MLETIVRYLHDSLIPFRLSSYPSAEAQPKAVQPTPKDGILVETRLVLSAGEPVIACWPADSQLDLAALSAELGSPVTPATSEELPESLRHLEGAPPPLGQLLGVAIVVDETVTRAGVIVFSPFDGNDFVEIPYEDYALLEQPRIASFARAGELAAAPRSQAAAPH